MFSFIQEVEKNARDFSWPEFITAVIKKKGEISLKKMRKLALAEFAKYNRLIKAEERVFKKLDKKLRAMNDIQIVKEKVSFKSSQHLIIKLNLLYCRQFSLGAALVMIVCNNMLFKYRSNLCASKKKFNCEDSFTVQNII